MPSWLVPVLLAVVALVMIVALSFQDKATDEIPYSDFVARVENGDVKVGRVGERHRDHHRHHHRRRGVHHHRVRPGPDELFGATLVEKVPEYNFVTTTPNFFTTMIPLLLPFLLIIGFFVWMNRRAQGQMGGIMSIGRSRAKTYSTERPATLFSDVAGYEGVKREIREVVDFLKEPERFLEIGARIPKGVLLVGPPGTGKTLIARAVAGEAGVPFLSVSGSDFMEMFVGVGASRVRDLFESARKHGRAIIFVDEIDSIGRKRGAGLGGGHDEREQTLNQMLSEMDGFESSEGIVMMAATNRPDILDPALLRPGRFDRQVVVPLPELEDRKAILAVHVRHKKLCPSVDLHVVARGTPGMSGADLANLVNESALTAVRRGAKIIEPHDFEEARDRVLMGQQRESMVLSDQEKEMTAFHEAGHALCAALLPTADPVHKVTILPRGMALGVTQQLPEEEKHSYSQEYLEESIVVAMGGRVAEELIFGQRSTGAANDLQVSTDRARKMVTEFGMSDRIGPRAWGGSGPIFLGDEMTSHREYSEDTTKLIDAEVEKMLRAGEDSCRELITANRRALDLIARQLLAEETISGAEVSRLIRVANGTEPDVASLGRPAPAGRRCTAMCPAPRPPAWWPHPRCRPTSSRHRAPSATTSGRSPLPAGSGWRPFGSVLAAARGHRARLTELGHGPPQVGGAHRPHERLAHHARAVGDGHDGHRLDPVALVQVGRADTSTSATATASLPSTEARARVSAQVAQVAEVNTATSHSRSSPSKSRRSSWAGASWRAAGCVGASGRRRRSTSATTTATTTTARTTSSFSMSGPHHVRASPCQGFTSRLPARSAAERRQRAQSGTTGTEGCSEMSPATLNTIIRSTTTGACDDTRAAHCPAVGASCSAVTTTLSPAGTSTRAGVGEPSEPSAATAATSTTAMPAPGLWISRAASSASPRRSPVLTQSVAATTPPALAVVPFTMSARSGVASPSAAVAVTDSDRPATMGSPPADSTSMAW